MPVLSGAQAYWSTGGLGRKPSEFRSLVRGSRSSAAQNLCMGMSGFEHTQCICGTNAIAHFLEPDNREHVENKVSR